MGFAIKMSINGIILLLFASVLCLSLEESSGSPVKNSEFVSKNYCRNHIFSPRCRGQQKRDLMSRSGDEYRLPPLEDFSGIDRTREIATILNSPSLLGELLRKAIETPSEYESEGNYLK